MKCHKRSQIIGQIFIYIVAIVLISFILVYGYKAIKMFQDKESRISYLQFKTDLQSGVRTIASDYGTVKTLKFQVPSGYRTVCFVRSYPELPTLSNPDYPLIVNNVNSDVGDNVFLVNDDMEESFSAGKIEVGDGEDMLCLDVFSGTLKLRIEGRGNRARLSLAE